MNITVLKGEAMRGCAARQAVIDAAKQDDPIVFLRALRSYEDFLVPWDPIESMLAARIGDPTAVRQ